MSNNGKNAALFQTLIIQTDGNYIWLSESVANWCQRSTYSPILVSNIFWHCTFKLHFFWCSITSLLGCWSFSFVLSVTSITYVWWMILYPFWISEKKRIATVSVYKKVIRCNGILFCDICSYLIYKLPNCLQEVRTVIWFHNCKHANII